MFSVFVPTESSLKKAATTDLNQLPESAVWIDLVKPTSAEDKAGSGWPGLRYRPGRTCRKSRFPADSISKTARAT